MKHYDVAVVGAGIVGLAHARAAARRGKRVVVIERDHQANGSSVRNFGFVTVTGQEKGQAWADAIASRHIWNEVAPAAGIAIHHRGLYVLAETEEAETVLEEFRQGPMGVACDHVSHQQLKTMPAFHRSSARSALYSPIDLRVEPIEALPKLAGWLAERHAVTFMFETMVLGIDGHALTTTGGTVEADIIVVCANNDRQSLYARELEQVEMTPCKLQMLRVSAPGWRLPGAVMSDFGLLRYLGYADCPSLEALAKRLHGEYPETIDQGIHLIAVQSADGSLVIGDSHDYRSTPDPFASEAVDALMMSHATRLLDLGDSHITHRWLGIYPSGPQHSVVLEVEPHVRVVVVTSGTGMSTSFGLAERVISQIFND